VVTDRQTHKPTPVKTYSLDFAERIRQWGIADSAIDSVVDWCRHVKNLIVSRAWWLSGRVLDMRLTGRDAIPGRSAFT